MTNLIDLSFMKSGSSKSKVSSYSNQIYDIDNINDICINKVLRQKLHHIDKNYIKNSQIYFFRFHSHKLKQFQRYFKNQIDLFGIISLKKNIFSLKIQLVDKQGKKISAKTTHHRTMLSNFVFEINGELQNFQLVLDMESGEFSLVFQLNFQFIDEVSMSDLIDYALQSYLEQCEVHFFVLNLLESIDPQRNQFLMNINEESQYLKRWLKERRIDNKKIRNNIKLYDHKSQSSQTQQINHQKSSLSYLKDMQNTLFPQSRKPLFSKQLNPLSMKQIYRKFKQFYQEEAIFSKYLSNRAKFKNYFNIVPKKIPIINGLVVKKPTFSDQTQFIQNYKQNLNLQTDESFQSDNQFITKNPSKIKQNSSDNQKLRIWQKNSDKSYFIQLLPLRCDLAKKEQIILQKLCKLQSYLFFNQYIFLQNIDLSQINYIPVNVNPSRTLLQQFLKNNDLVISLSLKLRICINLVQIFLTLSLKSKITNYFPQISVRNLQICKNLTLTFKFLSKLSENPLLELINTINKIIFKKIIKQEKQSHQNKEKEFILKGDQVQNKYWGISIHINILKYYLSELYEEALIIKKIMELRKNKAVRSQQVQQTDNWTKQVLIRSCQQLLIILNQSKNSLSKGNEDENYFEEDISQQF